MKYTVSFSIWFWIVGCSGIGMNFDERRTMMITKSPYQVAITGDMDDEVTKFEINNYTNNSLYPFPDFINAKNFDNYKIVFYDFGKGKYIKDNRIKENNHLDSNWKHGFTRGIVENQENEYEMWLIIW